MRLKELNIVNFKNIGEATLTFTSGFNCFVGKNGVGKTNILDAIYHLSMCKSYFNLSDTQNIRHEEPFFVVQGKYERDGEEIEIYCGVKRGFKKTFKKNQKAYD
ncbi:MAG: AAA family ATPase, partial [Odoribacter sp.]|nr:AAA family ATPase [Odoribacter sp.]